MNYFLIALILIALPTAFQIACGRASVRKKFRLRLRLACGLSFLTHPFAIFGGLEIVSADMEARKFHCGMPTAAIFFFGLVMTVILLLVIAIQLVMHFGKRKIISDNRGTSAL